MKALTPSGNPITAKAIRIANDLNGGAATPRQINAVADRIAQKGSPR